MNILMSVHHELREDAGAAGVTLRLADALRARGHAVDVISFDHMGGPARLKRYLFPWFVARFALRHPEYEVLDLSSGDGWILGLVRKVLPLNARRVFITRSHGLEHLMHEVIVEESRLGNRKLSWKYPLYNGGMRLWECRISFAYADAALFLNRHDLHYAVHHLGVQSANAYTVCNGIAAPFTACAVRLMSEIQPPGQPQNVAFIGTYQPTKGTEYLREAMVNIMARHPETRLGLFGTSVGDQAIRAAYPEAFRDRITVCPRYRNSELPGLLSDYHILAFPSLSEGYAVAPLEAMASGLVPVVAAARGPEEYIDDGGNGFVVPRRDAAALEARIEGLLSNPELWNSMRKRCLETAASASWDAVAGQAELIYAAASGTLGLADPPFRSGRAT